MNLLDQLQRDEGLRLVPYTDTTGNLTIGYGHNLSAKGITKGQALELLTADASDVVMELSARAPWTASLDDARRGALENMAFNLGVAGLLGFPTFLSFMQQGKWEEAADDLMTTLWSRQVGDRAVRLAQQIRIGVWV